MATSHAVHEARIRQSAFEAAEATKEEMDYFALLINECRYGEAAILLYTLSNSMQESATILYLLQATINKYNEGKT